MNYFLDKLQTRKIKLIKLLKNEYPNRSIAEISKELDCSNQTLMTTIESLIEDLKSFEINTARIRIVSKRIEADFDVNFSVDCLIHEYVRKSFEYQVILDCFFNTTKSISDYAKDFFLSQASTYRKINGVKNILKNFNIELQQSTTLQIVGEEKMIRYFYFSFFWETHSNINWSFEFSKEFIASFKKVIHSNAIKADHTLVNQNKIDIWFGIILTRIASGYSVGVIPQIKNIGDFNVNYLEKITESQAFFNQINPKLSRTKSLDELNFCYSIEIINTHYLVYNPTMEGLLNKIKANDQIYKVASQQFIESLDKYLSQALDKQAQAIFLANLFSVHLSVFLFDNVLSPFSEKLKLHRFDRIYPSVYKMLNKAYQDFIRHKAIAKVYHDKELLFPSYLLILYLSVDVKNYTEPIIIYLYSANSTLLEFLLKKELQKMSQYNLIFTETVTAETDLVISDTFNTPFCLSQESTLIWESVPSDSDWMNLRNKLNEIKKEKEFSRLE